LSIKFIRTDEGIAVTVRNRGAEKHSGSELPGLGLASMRERVHAAGGELSVDRARQGWTVAAQFNVAVERAVA
jgi:signal transduction histidine kinase